MTAPGGDHNDDREGHPALPGPPPGQPGGYHQFPDQFPDQYPDQYPPPYPYAYQSPPQYPYPYPPPYPLPEPPRGTNGLAIASLIVSAAGLLCGLGSIVGIVLGAVALEQIKRSRQEGYGLAIAGIVVGVAGLVVTMIVVIFAINSR